MSDIVFFGVPAITCFVFGTVGNQMLFNLMHRLISPIYRSHLLFQLSSSTSRYIIQLQLPILAGNSLILAFFVSKKEDKTVSRLIFIWINLTGHSQGSIPRLLNLKC